MTERLTNVDMDDKMIGKHAETTQHWDVMCSYDISAVNKVIAKEHIKNPVLANTSFDVNFTIPFKYTVSFNIKLGNPTITFLAGQSGNCEFSIPVIEGSKVTMPDGSGKNVAKDFPLGYSVTMTVPLANVSGNTFNESGKVITFGDKKDQSVVLHFDTKSGIGDTIAYQPPAVTDRRDQNILDDFITGFKDNIQDVDYCITTVKSQAGDSASGLTLTPKSFIFTSQVQDSDNPDQGGALNVWIQTNESGNDLGIHPSPVFQIGTDRYFPIPQNSTAAIFFAKKLIIDKYLQPVLSTIGTIDMKEEADNVGIQAKLELTKYTKDYSKTDRMSYEIDTFSCDKIVVDYTKNPIYFNFTRNAANVKWDWSQTISYEKSISNRYGEQSSYGKAEITGKIDNEYTVTFKDSSIDLAINTTNDINIDTSNAGSGKSWWQGFLGEFGIDDKQFRGNISDDISSQMHPIDLDFGGLNYFAEANIIFAEQAFTASDLSINGDVMLVGNVEIV